MDAKLFKLSFITSKTSTFEKLFLFHFLGHPQNYNKHAIK